MKIISVFDATVSSYNLGNKIIMESVYKHLEDVFPNDFFYKIPFMEITNYTLGYIKESDLIFLGGTNALSGRMEKYKQWGLNLFNSFFIKDVLLMGIGWWQYQKNVSRYTKYILHKVLSKKHFQSVRDEYTKQKLNELGFTNVLNTGCPTLWDLDLQHCRDIPYSKADNVVITVTDYHKNLERDKYWFEIIQRCYKKVYIWIQGSGDYEYVTEHFKGEYEIIPPRVNAFETILQQDNIEYVGTRLHAGIKAMQLKKRAIIIGIDNRAIEMRSDFGLNVIEHNNLTNLGKMIDSDLKTNIKLPVSLIQKWKNQFQSS